MRMQRGVTIPELMVTLAIVAAVMKFAVYPNIQYMVATARVKSSANELAIALTSIRSEAMKARNTRNIAAATGDWSKGWVVTNPATGDVVTEFHNIATTSTIGSSPVTTSFVVSGLTGFITQANGTTPLDLTFTVCDNTVNNERGFYVYLNRFGRVVVQRHSTTLCN